MIFLKSSKKIYIKFTGRNIFLVMIEIIYKKYESEIYTFLKS